MTRKRCTIKGCEGGRGGEQIMCRRHWFMVPQVLRNRIWQLYRTQRGTEAHLSAIREAIEHVNHQLDEQLLTSGTEHHER